MLRTSTLGSTGSPSLCLAERDEARDQSDRNEQSADDLLTAASPEDQLGSPPHEDGQPRQHAGKDEISHGADLVAGTSAADLWLGSRKGARMGCRSRRADSSGHADGSSARARAREWEIEQWSSHLPRRRRPTTSTHRTHSDDDDVGRYPQSGEIIRGRENRRKIMESYPGTERGITASSDRIVGSDDEFVTGPSWKIIHLSGSGDDMSFTGPYHLPQRRDGGIPPCFSP